MVEGPHSRAGQSDAEPSSATSEKHPAPLGSAEAPDAAANKRRRGLGVVTPNACTECRKKRAKCDGRKPCGRCNAQKVDCVYEIPVRQSKEHLRGEIDQLRKQQQQSDVVISSLAKPELWEEVLSRLRNGQSVESISEWLGGQPTRTLPSFTRSEPNPHGGVTLPPISGLGFGNAPPLHGSYPSHLAPQHVPKHEHDQPSPWAFSSQSQSRSTRSNSHTDTMQWSADLPPQARVGSWVRDQASPGGSGSSRSRTRGIVQMLAPFEGPEIRASRTTWTDITNDVNLVQHLLALYFCWEYPTFASLSKEHFLQDFLDGRPRYCSTILVNALLALGCRFSTQPKTRANENDPSTSGDHFFKECLRLLNQESNQHTLTTIQALGIMSIREASCGRDSESWFYAGQSVRLAVEMGLHRASGDGDEDEVAVQSATFWGAFALDHAWSLATGTLPQCSCFPQLPPKPSIIDDVEASHWVPYTDDGSNYAGAPLKRSCEQPSNVRSVYKCFCELSELVHQSLYVLHSPGQPVTSRHLLNIYTQYLDWYDQIPEVLRLGHNFTPAVLFAHMYYHFAILLLFRPLIKLRIINSDVVPRDICGQAADAIQGLLRSYSSLYTLRRTPSFVPYFVLTSSIMHLAVGALHLPTQSAVPDTNSAASTAKAVEDKPQPSASRSEEPSPSSSASSKLSPHVVEAINQGISDLTEMAPCHNFAEQALHILRYLAKKWNIEVTIPPPKQKLTKEESDQLCKPSTSSLNFFVPDMANGDFDCVWGQFEESSNQGVSANPEPPANSNTSESSPTKKEESGIQEGEEQMVDVRSAPATLSEMGASMDPRMQTEMGAGPMAHTAKSIENPLFWPFPMQGRPILPSGKMLEQAGFALL